MGPGMEQDRNDGSPIWQQIDVENEDNVGYWAERLGVTPTQVREAVARVGTAVGAVQVFLRGRR